MQEPEPLDEAIHLLLFRALAVNHLDRLEAEQPGQQRELEPLQVGARGTALPRLGQTGMALYVAGATVLYAGFLFTPSEAGVNPLAPLTEVDAINTRLDGVAYFAANTGGGMSEGEKRGGHRVRSRTDADRRSRHLYCDCHRRSHTARRRRGCDDRTN